MVATVTQHIDANSKQLVVLIESLELDQNVLIESPASSQEDKEVSHQMLNGGFEVVTEEVASLEIVEDNQSQSEETCNENNFHQVEDSPQIIIRQDELISHHFLVEGTTPLQLLLRANNQ